MLLKQLVLAFALFSANYFATTSIAQETDATKTMKPKEIVKDAKMAKEPKDMTLVDQKSSLTDAPEWMKYGVPGENHKALDMLAGKFTYTMKHWASAKAKPETSTGTSDAKWILNGRYLQETIEGKMGDQPFSGISILAYDNYRQEYQSIWIDSVSTGMWYMAGKGDKKSYGMSGVGGNPMTGEQEHKFRSVTKVKSANEHTYEMYSYDKDGKEFRSMEIVYKRAK